MCQRQTNSKVNLTNRAAVPSHSGHSSGSGGSAGTSVREPTPECAAVPSSPQPNAVQPATPSRSGNRGGDEAAERDAPISPPSSGWRPSSSQQRARNAPRSGSTTAADAADAQLPARSPQTRRQLALHQEQQQLELALARSAAEQQGPPAAKLPAAEPPVAAVAPPAQQPAQPAATPHSEAAAQPEAAPAPAPAETAEVTPAAEAAAGPADATAPGPAAAAPSTPTELPSDKETISLVAVSDDDIDVGTTSALQVIFDAAQILYKGRNRGQFDRMTTSTSAPPPRCR